jgi:hypothetical protein
MCTTGGMQKDIKGHAAGKKLQIIIHWLAIK